MNDQVLTAIIATVVPLFLAITGAYTVYQMRHTRRNEADEVRAKADEIVERVRAMQWQREQDMMLRLGQLETDRSDLTIRLAAVEFELRMTRKQYESDLQAERQNHKDAMEKARRVQESLESELIALREMVLHLTKENEDLQAKIKQLASRVETGELGSDKHKRASG